MHAWGIQKNDDASTEIAETRGRPTNKNYNTCVVLDIAFAPLKTTAPFRQVRKNIAGAQPARDFFFLSQKFQLKSV